jgi:anti-sigma B factor antagonist
MEPVSESTPTPDTASQPGAVRVALHDAGHATIVVEVTGDVDMATAPDVRERINTALERRPTTLVVDLLGVEFLASAGLSLLIEVRKHALDEGIRLAVVAEGLAVRRPLEITGLDAELDIYPTQAAALAGQ